MTRWTAIRLLQAAPSLVSLVAKHQAWERSPHPGPAHWCSCHKARCYGLLCVGCWAVVAWTVEERT